MLSLDVYGEIFMNFFINNPHHTFTLNYFFVTKKITTTKIPILRIFCRHAGSKVFSMFTGKSGLTSTGKASLIVGCITGFGYLIDSQLTRWHEEAMLTKKLEFEQIEAQRSRDFQAIENAKNRTFQEQENQKNRIFQQNQKKGFWEK